MTLFTYWKCNFSMTRSCTKKILTAYEPNMVWKGIKEKIHRLMGTKHHQSTLEYACNDSIYFECYRDKSLGYLYNLSVLSRSFNISCQIQQTASSFSILFKPANPMRHSKNKPYRKTLDKRVLGRHNHFRNMSIRSSDTFFLVLYCILCV